MEGEEGTYMETLLKLHGAGCVRNAVSQFLPFLSYGREAFVRWIL